MPTYKTENNLYRLHGKQSEDDYMCMGRVCHDSECELGVPNRHALYHRNLLIPDQHELDFPNRHALHHRNLRVPDQPDYNASNQQQRICCNCNGNLDVCGQHQNDTDIYQPGNCRISGTHNVNGGEICPVLATVGAAVAVGVIVKASEKYVVPKIIDHYDKHIKPNIDSAVNAASVDLKKISKSIEPTIATKPPSTAPKEEHAAGGCSLM